MPLEIKSVEVVVGETENSSAEETNTTTTTEEQSTDNTQGNPKTNDLGIFRNSAILVISFVGLLGSMIFFKKTEK